MNQFDKHFKQELGTVLRRIGERMSDKELKDMVDEVVIIIIIIIVCIIVIIVTTTTTIIIIINIIVIIDIIILLLNFNSTIMDIANSKPPSSPSTLQVDADKSGAIEFDEFVTMMAKRSCYMIMMRIFFFNIYDFKLYGICFDDAQKIILNINLIYFALHLVYKIF